MSKKEFFYNKDLYEQVQQWPYPAFKDITPEEFGEWYNKEGWRGKTFIFKQLNEYNEGQKAHSMGYALACGLGAYVGVILLCGFIGVWFLFKLLKLLGY